jgi:hypothetical protein
MVAWTTIHCARPFDVIFVDIWFPGEIPNLDGDNKFLNMIEGMSGFVTGAPLQIVNSHAVAQSMYQQVFTKFGLPRLLVVDAGSEFQATIEAVTSLLHVRIVRVPPELHHAQRCERFHRFPNKVVLIMVQDRAEVSSCHTSYAQDFRFPLDHSLEEILPLVFKKKATVWYMLSVI